MKKRKGFTLDNFKRLIKKNKNSVKRKKDDNIFTANKEKRRIEKERRKLKKIREGNFKSEERHVTKKIKKEMIIFLGFCTLIVFIICKILFSYTFVAIAFAILFILATCFAQILDNSSKNSAIRKGIKGISIIVLLIGTITIISFIAFFIYVAVKAPEFDVSKLERGETSLIYDKDNGLMGTLGTEKREKVTYDELPEVLIDAIVATEDSRFFQHNGFDAPRFIKAAFGQILGRNAGGASTLTMQVSKNNFTTSAVSIVRKFTDIYLSIFKIERAFTKQEIIEFYVNAPYLGSNSYGVEQASMTYFGKSAKNLNLSEAALIAGLFQAPSDYDPNINKEAAYERREVVLELMLRHGYITKEEMDIANSISIESLLKNSSYAVANEYQSYIDEVIKEVIKKTGLDPYLYPMLIYTNMDRGKQETINAVFNGATYAWPNDTVQAGAALIESNSGKVLAIGGGRNRKGERVFNYATEINRQIGSTAKPLFDYGPGIEYNNWGTGKIFDDKEIDYAGGHMSNYDFRYIGKTTLRWSLRDSRNVPALEAFREVDNANILQFVTSLGIKPEVDEYGGLHEAHAIGGFNGSNPLTMAGAYAAFSNGGYYYEPYLVNKIILRNSDEEMEFKSTKNKVMNDSTAYMITDILKENARDYGVSSVVNTTIAAKSGTTNYDDETIRKYNYASNSAPDGWICGYSNTYSMAMWTGYTENIEGVYFTQNSMAYHRNNLYKALASGIFTENTGDFTRPSSVVSVTLEKNTELLPSEWTPADMKVTELYKRGTEPTEISNAYVPCENVTNLKAKIDNGSVILTWDALTEPKDDKKDDNWGEFGYFIYKDNEYINFTTDTKYILDTDSPYGEYRVITGYKNKDTNKSSGATVTLKSDISFKYNGSYEVTLSVGDNFVEENSIITAYEKDKDVTNNANIDKVMYDSNNEIVSSISTSVKGTYKIIYTVMYKGESESFIKTVTIIDKKDEESLD